MEENGREGGRKKRAEKEARASGRMEVANVCMINRSQLGKYVSYIRRRGKCMYNCSGKAGKEERAAGSEGEGRL